MQGCCILRQKERLRVGVTAEYHAEHLSCFTLMPVGAVKDVRYGGDASVIRYLRPADYPAWVGMGGELVNDFYGRGQMDCTDEDQIEAAVTHYPGEWAHLSSGEEDLDVVPPLPVIDLIYLAGQPT